MRLIKYTANAIKNSSSMEPGMSTLAQARSYVQNGTKRRKIIPRSVNLVN